MFCSQLKLATAFVAACLAYIGKPGLARSTLARRSRRQVIPPDFPPAAATHAYLIKLKAPDRRRLSLSEAFAPTRSPVDPPRAEITRVPINPPHFALLQALTFHMGSLRARRCSCSRGAVRAYKRTSAVRVTYRARLASERYLITIRNCNGSC